MDTTPCRVIYVNRSIDQNRLERGTGESFNLSNSNADDWKHNAVLRGLQPLVDSFGDVHVCSSGSACLSKVFEDEDKFVGKITPTLVLIDTPCETPAPDTDATPSPTANTHDLRAEAFDIHAPDEDLYGLNLLQKLISESRMRKLSKTVIPVPVIRKQPSFENSAPQQSLDGVHEASPGDADITTSSYRSLVRKCLDLGAGDVVISPINEKCITTLEVSVYRSHRDAARDHRALMDVSSGRKLSWVGVSDQKPYAYLREAMVSGLMNGICRLSPPDDHISSAHISVSTQRQDAIAQAIGRWHFCAHSFSDDELLVAAMLIFKHALSVPELEQWRLPTEQLIRFLVACRTAYNNFVPYHNFRHVVDVLQATFSFLVRIGVLPPYLSTPSTPTGEKSPVAQLLCPFDALTLLVTAIGHDVGHPGVNNGFLTTLNAPLAQLYNDRSVLESFHCAAYSQILRRYWPATFEDRKMRNLMISSILATDMGLHFDYMKKLGDLQEKLHDNNNSAEGWNGRQLEDHKSLACSLLIKCADISNVARQHDTALKWMHILSEEVSRQASMENELDIKSSLMAAPKKDMLSMANAQLGFMNMFAIPLFQGVADIMPAMNYTVEELEINKGLFEQKVVQEKAKQNLDVADVTRQLREGTLSPRTRSFIEEQAAEAKPTETTSKQPQADETRLDDQTESVNGTPQTVLEMSPAESTEHQPVSPQNLSAHSTLNEPAPLSGKDSFYLNGSLSSFDAVRELAHSDPFNCRIRGDSSADKTFTSAGQRCSETTEGSLSGAFGGDWASQATSAATGKHALSPSTQGTSIVSNDSMDRTVGVSTLSASPPGAKSLGAPVQLEPSTSEEYYGSPTGSIGKAEGKTLKKRPSRFRMKDFPFFRRNKGSTSPPFPASDPAG